MTSFQWNWIPCKYFHLLTPLTNTKRANLKKKYLTVTFQPYHACAVSVESELAKRATILGNLFINVIFTFYYIYSSFLNFSLKCYWWIQLEFEKNSQSFEIPHRPVRPTCICELESYSKRIRKQLFLLDNCSRIKTSVSAI